MERRFDGLNARAAPAEKKFFFKWPPSTGWFPTRRTMLAGKTPTIARRREAKKSGHEVQSLFRLPVTSSRATIRVG